MHRPTLPVYLLALTLTLLSAVRQATAQTSTAAPPTPSTANPAEPMKTEEAAAPQSAVGATKPTIAKIVVTPPAASISPPPATPGQKVTITGAGFGATQGKSTVGFGTTPAAVGSGDWSDTSITATIPDVKAGPVDVVVSAGGGSSAPYPFNVIVPNIMITVTPKVIQPANGKLPASANLAVFVKGCDNSSSIDLTQGVSAPYGIMITGSGLTPSAPTAMKCWVTASLTVTPNASGPFTVFLQDKAGNPVGSADMNVLDASAGPVPPGLGPQVDVMWEVMSQKNCADAFGKRVALSLYCIQVKIGNDSGYPLQIAGIGFSRDSEVLEALGYPRLTIANSSYGSTRAVLVHEQPISVRNITYNTLQGAGLIMAAASPFFGKSTTSHYSTFNTIVNGPLLAAYNLVFPDPIVKQLNNLDDQSFRDNIVIPNNAHIQTLVFVEKQALTESLGEVGAKLSSQVKRVPDSDSLTQEQQFVNLMADRMAKDIRDTVHNSTVPFLGHFWGGRSSDPLLVKLALGRLVIVGYQIEYLQRVQVQGSAAQAPATSPLSAKPSSLSFSSQNGVTSGAAQSVTLTNTGTAPLTDMAPKITGTGAGDFTIQANGTNSCSSTLAAGNTCALSVIYKPSPTGTANSRIASLEVSFSPGSTPLAIALTGAASDTVYFSTTTLDLGTATAGKAAVGSAAATPAKPSTAQLTITNFNSVALSKVDLTPKTGEFIPGTCNSGTLDPNSSCTVTVTFTPKGPGKSTSAITVTYQVSGSTLTQPISVTGTGQ